MGPNSRLSPNHALPQGGKSCACRRKLAPDVRLPAERFTYCAKKQIEVRISAVADDSILSCDYFKPKPGFTAIIRDFSDEGRNAVLGNGTNLDSQDSPIGRDIKDPVLANPHKGTTDL